MNLRLAIIERLKVARQVFWSDDWKVYGMLDPESYSPSNMFNNPTMSDLTCRVTQNRGASL